MAKSKGRPKKAESMEKTVGFWVTHKQYFIIQQKAEEAHVTIAEYMRQVAINGYVEARFTQEERDIFKGLIGIANNINQLVVIAKKEEAPDAVLFFMKCRDKMDKIVNRFCEGK